jgi:hypothetical protein
MDEILKKGTIFLPLINKPKGKANNKTPKNRNETNEALS